MLKTEISALQKLGIPDSEILETIADALDIEEAQTWLKEQADRQEKTNENHVKGDMK